MRGVKGGVWVWDLGIGLLALLDDRLSADPPVPPKAGTNIIFKTPPFNFP